MELLLQIREICIKPGSGIIPIDAAKHHRDVAETIYTNALEEAKINESAIDGIAFSQGPGLPPCLIEGIKFAKKLSRRLNKPLIPVNHCVAHLEIGKVTGAKDPVLLYASGANTQIIAYADGKYRIFGETLDIGVGNFIDNFARYAGIGFPGGPKIEKLALNGKNYIELPYTVKGMDIALSGILTNLRQKIEKQQYSLEDLSYSMQKLFLLCLLKLPSELLLMLKKTELLLGGGVACNLRLEEMSKLMCAERGINFFVPNKSLLVDNGAMIAFLGEIMFNSGIEYSGKKADELDILPSQRTDQVKVTWR
jgi:N6-L-threonylcarbamoyladenine synthase